jgi:hypothetical protein
MKLEYIHTDSGNKYFVIKNAMLKTNTGWVSAIIYENQKGETFVRSADEFSSKFEAVNTQKSSALSHN